MFSIRIPVSTVIFSVAFFAQTQTLFSSDRFGQRQLDQMLADRPDMGLVILKGDFIYNWIANRLAGSDVHERIYWDATEPESLAQHMSGDLWSPACIWVSSSEEISGCDKCVYVMFELMNIENEPQFNDLKRKAALGRISRSEYAIQGTRLEFEAASITKDAILQHAGFEKLRICEGFNKVKTMAELNPKDEHAFARRARAQWSLEFDLLFKGN